MSGILYAGVDLGFGGRSTWTDVCPLQLVKGTAEIFGAELQQGVQVNVAGQKLAVSVSGFFRLN